MGNDRQQQTPPAQAAQAAPRVLIATPHSDDQINIAWLDSFLALEKPDGWMRGMISRRLVSSARNLLVWALLEDSAAWERRTRRTAAWGLVRPDTGQQATHIFFLDDDVLPPRRWLASVAQP
jgi:hypothetical protein